MNKLKIGLIAVSAITLGACAATEDSTGEITLIDTTPLASVNPADPQSVSDALQITGAVRRSGSSPFQSIDISAPVVANAPARLTISPGGSAILSFSYASTSGYSNCYVEVDGAGDYFDIPEANPASTPNQAILQVPIALPQVNLTQEGTFCTYASIADSTGLVSNSLYTCFDTISVGTGDLQVSLSWDTTADIDLYVTEPSGNTIYFGNRANSSTGGQLDVDDTNGYGPENIFWDNGAPSGTYLIEVDHFSGASPTDYVVTITTPTGSQRFSGTLVSGGRDTIANVTVSSNGGVTFTKASNVTEGAKMQSKATN